MHVLILPSWYHTRSLPTAGLYFAEHAQALSESGLQVGIAYPEARSLREWSIGAMVQNHWQTTSAPEAGISTVRRHGWRLIPRCRLHRARARSYLGLASSYAAQYGRPDLLHAHGALAAGVGALLTARRLGIPFCVTEHFSCYGRGQASGRERRLTAEVYRHAAGVAAVSTALCRDLQTAVAADLRPRVIPNVVDTAFFTPKLSGPQGGAFTFVTVSDLVPVKRVDLLIDAFNAAFAADPTVSLVIGGDGPCRAALESQARQQPAAARIHFLGRLQGREAVRDCLWQADAFALASSYETFGVVLVEALACGLPVVATRCGGPTDIVTPEVGLLCDSDDTRALRDALLRMRAQHPQYEGRSLHAYAQDRFGRDAVVQLTLRMYSEALHCTVQ